MTLAPNRDEDFNTIDTQRERMTSESTTQLVFSCVFLLLAGECERRGELPGCNVPDASYAW